MFFQLEQTQQLGRIRLEAIASRAEAIATSNSKEDCYYFLAELEGCWLRLSRPANALKVLFCGS